MKFLHPSWLWGLLIIPLLYWVVWFDEKLRVQKFSQFINPSLWSQIVPEWNPKARPVKARWWLAGLAFGFLALARPQMGSHEESVQISGLDVMIILDVSNSMEVEDVVPSRIQKAKHMIHTLLNRLEGDRVGVVAFAGSSYIASPLTTDLNYVWETVQTLGPKVIKNQGTDISLGLETAFRAMERGAEERASARAESTASRVMILISDGEDHEEQINTILAKIKKGSTKLYIFGVGTEAGGPIPLKDAEGNSQGFKRTRGGDPVISTFHPQVLMDAAQTIGGKYWNATAGEAEIEELLKEIGALDRTDYAERKFLVYEERYQIPLFIAIVLFLIELSVSTRKRVSALLILFGFQSAAILGMGHLAEASEVGHGNVTGSSGLSPGVSVDAYLENEKGIKAYKEGKIEEAQKDFGSAQARDPSLPELEFNQGAVQLQQGDVDHAIQSFSNSARMAKEKGNDTLVGKSLYNLGNVLTKKGELGSAVRSYIGAIEAAKAAKNEKLENQARKNLQLIEMERKKQQEQKQQQEQQQENQEQKDKKQDQEQKPDKQDKADKKDDQKGEQEGKQESKQREEQSGSREKKYKESSKQQFKSKRMSQEDAERVMSELANKEQQLQSQEKVQEKFKSQHGKSQTSSKDW